MKVLVTAATRHGSTAEIAAAIAGVLRRRGVDVDQIAPSDVHDITRYDAVVLGSAVYAGRWLKSATAFVSRWEQQLTQRPVWLFSSGPIGQPPKPAELPVVAQIVCRTHAVEHRVLAGRLDKDGLGLLERTMVRAVRAPEGDYRDWLEINEWAAGIADDSVPAQG